MRTRDFLTTETRRWYALALLCTAAFMVILDASIVIVAVPSIQRDLHFAPGGVQWVMTAYVVTFAGLLLFGGRTADLLGRRRMFMAGVALFGGSSLLCGLAWSGGALITARTVQGVSAAVMTPTAFSIVLAIFTDGRERNRAIGVWGAVAGVGGTAGALVGGPLTEGPGWQWIFFINVPVAAGLLALSRLLLPESRNRTRGRAFDAAGAMTITVALALLVYAVAQAPSHWRSTQTIGTLTLAGILVALFARIESRATNPLVPLRVLRSRSLVGGNVIGLCAGMAAYGQGFVLTQYTQQVLGWSAAKCGVLTAVMPVLAVVGSMVGQHLVTRVGFRNVAVVSMILLAAGCLLLNGLPVGGSYVRDVLPGLVLFGPGLGAGSVAGAIAAVAGVSQSESGLASGLSNMSFQIGGALGIAVLSTVAVSRTGSAMASGASHLPALAAGFSVAFAVAAVFAVAGLIVAWFVLRRPDAPAAERESAVASAREN